MLEPPTRGKVLTVRACAVVQGERVDTDAYLCDRAAWERIAHHIDDLDEWTVIEFDSGAVLAFTPPELNPGNRLFFGQQTIKPSLAPSTN